MTPIAVYESRRFQDRRRFELDPDAIRAEGSTIRGDFAQTIPLARIDPAFARTWSYGVAFLVGVWVFVIGIFILLVVVGFALLSDARAFPAVPAAIAGIVGAVGFAGALVNRRKVEFAVFHSDAGVPILAIPRGRSSDFDSFIALLIEQVGMAKAGAQRVGPSALPRDDD